jgi:hypothetical protein
MKVRAHGVEVCQREIQADLQTRVRTNGRVVPLLIAAAGDLIQSRNRCVGQLSTGDADNRCTGRLIRAIRYRECRMTADTAWHSM